MTHHGAGLRRLLKDRDRADAIRRDPAAVEMSERERAITDYAVKLTREPGAMARHDLDPLRAAGLGDAEILDVCQVTAYYNYVNRLADGLGVELEAYWDRVKGVGDER